ncbi:hypothetical protein OSB04_029295 [Centaurea solstitialis]|uniref:Uncharacterized protein n=1 Tax=Centaurea solstitialis TaxID=347529 RepID=A0AA38SHA6_9ASTR|nr:hypothetical protein OSB04_029295 [Centaurea solstitialis]
MDELEFQRVLHLFPVVRTRDYNAESEIQRQLTTQASRRLREKINSQIEGGSRGGAVGGIDGQDAFWEKLKIAAAKKSEFVLAMTTRSTNTRIEDLECSVGSIEKNQQLIEKRLEKFFQRNEKLSSDAASKLNSATNSDAYEFDGSGDKKVPLDDNRRKFVELDASLDNILEEVFISQFINSLENMIRAELHLSSPVSLGEAMEVASKIEMKNKANGRTSAVSRKSSTVITLPVTNVKKEDEHSARSGRVSGREMSSKEEEKSLTSVVNRKSPTVMKYNLNGLLVFVIVVMGIEEMSLEVEEKSFNEAEMVDIGQKVDVHLNSVVGLSNPKTMKLEGVVDNQRVVVLIDSGATHNFISKDVASKLKLTLEVTKEYYYHGYRISS